MNFFTANECFYFLSLVTIYYGLGHQENIYKSVMVKNGIDLVNLKSEISLENIKKMMEEVHEIIRGNFDVSLIDELADKEIRNGLRIFSGRYI